MDEYVDHGVGSSALDAHRLERLWAPYRVNYIAAADKSEDPFVSIAQQPDEQGLVIARGSKVYCVLNLFPYNPGHMLVVPYRQVADLVDLDAQEAAELTLFTQHAIRALRRVSSPEAINIGMNLGRASGGSISHHLHQHIVPRWSGDANFMTVIAGARVLPQALQDTRRLLADAWQEVA